MDLDKQFLTKYQRTCITREPDGSYTVQFPWKPNHTTLPTNFTVCERRARALARKLAMLPDLLSTYNNILNYQIERGFIEEIHSTVANCHYIPHHAVKKQSPTTPIRIVYVCNCHQSNASPSLNGCLQIGALFLQDLCLIIVWFHLHRFAISTDIEKAFYMSTYMKMAKISLDSCGSQTHQIQKVSLLCIGLRLCCLELPAHHLFWIQLLTIICHIILLP